jgi:hypothetical protein
MGLDPGYRTGVKVAVVSETGQTAATTTIYPHEPQRRWDEAIAQLARLAQEHRVELIAIGNGTASRETDRLGAELIRLHPELELTKVVVSEAGASVYSASAFASHEPPSILQHERCTTRSGVSPECRPQPRRPLGPAPAGGMPPRAGRASPPSCATSWSPTTSPQRSARLAPAMISTLRVPRRRQRGAPPGPGAIRPGSALIEEVRFATVSPPEGDDSNPRSPIYGELAARGRARHEPRRQ